MAGPGNKIARRIFRDEPIDKRVYTRLCGAADIEKRFLESNVFALNAAGLYAFEDKAVGHEIRERLGEARVGLGSGNGEN
jgi:hypothetical protein